MTEPKPYKRWTPARIDEAYDELEKRLGKTPIYQEFSKEYGGALGAIVHGNYIPSVKTWNSYLKHRKKETRDVGKWKPEEIDRVFNEEEKRLGRTPTYREFQLKYGGALSAIVKGRYDPQIRSWGSYLKHIKGSSDNEEKWSQERIDTIFKGWCDQLGRTPTSIEFKGKYPLAFRAIVHRNYLGSINKWNQFLEHHGKASKKNSLDPSEICERYFSLKQKIGKVPNYAELQEHDPQVLRAIVSKEYKTSIWKLSDFLSDVEPLYRKKIKMSPTEILARYDNLKKELGEQPTYREFQLKCGDALSAIVRGMYKKSIRRWADFLKDIGEETRIITPESLRKRFYKLKRELGRCPTVKELKYSSMFKNGTYDPSVRNYGQFLISLGESAPKREYWSSSKVEQAYYKLKKELGRQPTSVEFAQHHRGALAYIRDKKYDSQISTWNEFLKNLREEILLGQRWNQETLDKAYDDLWNLLGREPRSSEFIAQYHHGAMFAILHGRYHNDIKSWKAFVLRKREGYGKGQGKDPLEQLLDGYIGLNVENETSSHERVEGTPENPS